ncbi:ATP-binding protein [Iningainema tapete]|uniref:Circadian input-output histidine kinase CikA n=1 Tax=Iningainema tapete BLCC-T55 TaxID=2748662 RepID=A0A8J7BZF7_9CYAN|nr:ATP-binding protein [Iningainema tapete]MBD2775773.1 response regulator [Iningainema tapete BLCC-T55]
MNDGQRIDTFPGVGEMRTLMREFDWASTPVGAVETWSQSLKSTVKILLASRYPMILIWGDNLIQFYNDAYSKLIGDKHPAALGTDIRITLSEAWDTLGPMIDEVMATGVANWVEAQMLVLERSGYREESYFSLSHAPAEDDAGQIVGMFCVCSEVTQQVLGERRLRLLRDLASKAGETRSVETTCKDVADAIASHPLDVPFALIYLREPDGKLTLRGRIQMLSSDLLSPESVDLSASETDIWSLKAAATGETILVEGVERYESLPGGPWNEPTRAALVMPLASSEKTAPLGVLVAGVSPNRALDEGYRSFYELLAAQVSVAIRNAQAYEEEKRRAEMLAELDRAKTAFFSNVSHEFRTPLTLMLSPLEDALSNPQLPTQERERITVAYRNSLRLLKLVNTLLDFSRIEAGRMQAVYEPTDLATLTTDLASVFRSAIEKAGLQLIVDCPTLPEQVYVDRDMWEKIVLNLLSNALKFTQQGYIAVRQRIIGENIVLEVEDTGCGIPESEIDNVFKRFYRIEGTQGRTYEGTGIGLALVQQLALLHGGTVRVQSVYGAGSTFSVSILRGKDHLSADKIGNGSTLTPTNIRADAFLEEALRWLPEGEGEKESEGVGENEELLTNSSKPTILLADDNTDMREYVCKLLQKQYEVVAVADGEAALAAVSEQVPDLVLSDVMMPKLDGFGLLTQLRQNQRTCSVPIILLSARAGEESRVEGLEAGADDYLVKPFSARELLARVKATLEMARLRQEAIRSRLEEERREAELESERAARQEAERIGRIKDEFLATLSHELRTPLNAILGWSNILRKGNVGSAQLNKGLETIERNSRSQAQIIEDLLDMSKIISGKIILNVEKINLSSVIEVAIASFVPAAQAKDIQLQTVLNDSISMIGDANRLQQVLWNLLSNAIKFTPSGGKVQVSLKKINSHIELTVSDTGLGIKPEFLPYVFERFRQADSSTTRKFGGLGLGLSIVKHLVELHGGTVQATSPGVGQGSVFTVALPLAHRNSFYVQAENGSLSDD